MLIKKASKTVKTIEKLNIIRPSNFIVKVTDESKNSPKVDINNISKCPAVKLLDKRNAILNARIILPKISIPGRNKLKTTGTV